MDVLAVVLVSLVVLEAGSWVIGRFANRLLGVAVPSRREFLARQSAMLERLAANQSVRARLHPVLGWEYGTGPVSATEHLSAQGLRGVREYGVAAAPGVRRIAVFGDSYVYCNEVQDVESWPAQIEAGWRSEVLNYGVGGYGADQAFLRFREEGARLNPQVVIMGFTSMMATRVVSRYRRFQDPTDGPWFKPRFLLEGDSLSLLSPPVASAADAARLLAAPLAIREFGRHDFWYNRAVFEHALYPWSATYRLAACVGQAVRRRYFDPDRIFEGGTLNPQSEAFRLLERIFRDFAAAVRAIGAEPVALMLPPRDDVMRHNAPPSYGTIRPRLEQLGLVVIDPLRALTSSGIPVAELFAPGGHYSRRGNAIVAQTVAEALHLVPRS